LAAEVFAVAAGAVTPGALVLPALAVAGCIPDAPPWPVVVWEPCISASIREAIASISLVLIGLEPRLSAERASGPAHGEVRMLAEPGVLGGVAKVDDPVAGVLGDVTPADGEVALVAAPVVPPPNTPGVSGALVGAAPGVMPVVPEGTPVLVAGEVDAPGAVLVEGVVVAGARGEPVAPIPAGVGEVTLAPGRVVVVPCGG